MHKISFNNKNSPFFTSVKEKVNTYFEENNLSKSGGGKLYAKALLQIASALVLYLVLVFFNPGILLSIAFCVLLGMNMAVIGFNVMHEGGHQSLSKYAIVNSIGAYFLNILGGNTYFWKIKHNINHHTYTNIEGMDSDIDIQPFMRLHASQKHYWIHNFQHIYCILLYGISYLSWIFWDDFQKYFSGKVAEGSKNKLSLKEHIIFWTTKMLYLLVYLGLPMYVLGIGNALIGFGIVCFVCGLSIATVFQLAHVVEVTNFPVISGEKQLIDQEWAIHQVCTTANFATRNPVISWLLGGLNFQVEHHLFPRISHIHYPKINEFVKEVCTKYDIEYLEYSSMVKAIGSHFSHIRAMGKA